MIALKENEEMLDSSPAFKAGFQIGQALSHQDIVNLQQAKKNGKTDRAEAFEQRLSEMSYEEKLVLRFLLIEVAASGKTIDQALKDVADRHAQRCTV